MEKEENKDVSLSEMLNMKFKETGELESADLGNTKVFRKLNHHERRVKAAIERRLKKRKGKQ